MLLVVAVLVTILGGTLPGTSSAALTSKSTNTASTFSAAADWTSPTVTMNSPGGSVSGTATVSATAADADTGLASVLIEYLAPGAGAWTPICTATAAPWSCSWNTKATGVTDGTYSLRATATDRSGNSTVSDPVTTTVANNLTVVLNDPGSTVRGTTTLSGSIYGNAGTAYSLTIESAPNGATAWKSVCSPNSVTSTFTCAWDTTALTSGSYDLKVTVLSGRTVMATTTIVDTLVDNTAPTVTMMDPGATLTGTVTLAAAANDVDSGVNQVVIQYAATGTPTAGTWSTACTLTAAPYSCRFDTTKLAAGRYDLRAVATDAAGNTTTSPVLTGRTVDNSVSSVSMEDPGAYLTGAVMLKASASASAGVRSVVIQRAPNGGTTWTTVCTIASGTSPYSCSFDSTTVADGLFDFRAILTDAGAKTSTSAVVAARRVDNTALRGYDVQATNGGSNGGRLESGDSLTLTYTDTVKLSTITPSFTGAALPVTIRLRDGVSLGLGSKDDTVDVLVGGTVINLGSIDLEEDYVRSGKSVTFASTMTATTVAAGSTNRTVVTIKLGAASSNAGLRTAATAQAMVWSPSAGVTDAYGTAGSAAPVAELGALDKDF